MSRSFKLGEVFPIIVDVVQKMPGGKDGFRSHEAIVGGLLEYPISMALIVAARASNKLPDDRAIASNMLAFFSQKITMGQSPWGSYFERIKQGATYSYRPRHEDAYGIGPDLEYEAIEGEKRLVSHLLRERDPAIAKKKRDSSRAPNGGLACEACGKNSRNVFPDISGDSWEVHHRLPLSHANKAVQTKLEDLAVLCPTCHRAIHKTKPMTTVRQFASKYFPLRSR